MSRIASPTASVEPPRVAFAVARSVGSAVVRNRTRRRLRALLATRAPALGSGAALLVRARAGAEGLRSDELAVHLDRALAGAS